MKRLTLLLFLMAMLARQVQAGVPAPKGVWEFNGSEPNGATIGAPLELVGSVEEIMGLDAADGAIRIGEGSYYICTHGIAPNGDGAKVNEWTLLIDFSYPPSSRSDPPNGYNDLFQTDPTNVNDADWTINSSGAIGIGAVGYSSAFGYTTEANIWYRLVVVVDNGVRHDVYVDGVEIFQGNQQGIDGRFSLEEALLLFCAGNSQDRDDAPIDVSTVAIWDTPLSANDIVALGWAGDSFFTQKLASNPAPADGSDDVLNTADLIWTAGDYAATHNVYFGSSADDVNTASPAALVAEGLARDVNSLDIGRLDFGQTYYWRVDEVNGAPDFDVIEGKVWSFTVEPFAYAIDDIAASSNGSAGLGTTPDNTVNGSGLNANDEHSFATADMWLAIPAADPLWIQYEFDRPYKLHEMWVWNYNVQFELVLGFGLKDVTIEYSEDGESWTSFGAVEFAQGTAQADYAHNTTVALDGAIAKYVRLNVNSGWGVAGQFGLSEVRFLYIPVRAREPEPADGAVDVDREAVLNWRPGREAASHEIHLGIDPESLARVGTGAETTFAPDDLLFGATYYWRVDEVNEVQTTPVWKGVLWSFSTQEFATIDDFEDYDNESHLIYETWIDGWGNGTGSTVGYLTAPFAETSIVHRGRQSMPLEYNNTAGPYYSEVERDLGGADWTTGGADALRLYVQGSADNDPGTLYVAVEDASGNVA
ncbi:MAG: discoidin domain-containing protein, partial [Planctomycetota bacterium]